MADSIWKQMQEKLDKMDLYNHCYSEASRAKAADSYNNMTLVLPFSIILFVSLIIASMVTLLSTSSPTTAEHCGGSLHQPIAIVPAKYISNLQIKDLENGEAVVTPMHALSINRERQAYLNLDTEILDVESFDITKQFLLVYKKENKFYVITHNRNKFETNATTGPRNKAPISKLVILLQGEEPEATLSFIKGSTKEAEISLGLMKDIDAKEQIARR